MMIVWKVCRKNGNTKAFGGGGGGYALGDGTPIACTTHFLLPGMMYYLGMYVCMEIWVPLGVFGLFWLDCPAEGGRSRVMMYYGASCQAAPLLVASS
jgi:hypothetical protein